MEYKVIVIAESWFSALFFGSANLPTEKIEAALNAYALEGWQVVFEVIEKRRLFLFWTREAMVVTLSRTRPE